MRRRGAIGADPSESDRIKPNRGVFGGGGGWREVEGWIGASPGESDRIKPKRAHLDALLAAKGHRRSKKGRFNWPASSFLSGCLRMLIIMIWVEWEKPAVACPPPCLRSLLPSPSGLLDHRSTDRRLLCRHAGRKCSKCHAKSVAFWKNSRRLCAALEIGTEKQNALGEGRRRNSASRGGGVDGWFPPA